MPDPPVIKGMSAQAAPIDTRSWLVSASVTANETPSARSSANRLAMAAVPLATVWYSTRPTRPATCRCRTRTRLGSLMGVNGWLRIPDSLSSSSPTNR